MGKQCSKPCPEGRICSATEVSTWAFCEHKGDVYSCNCPSGNYLMISADYCFKVEEFEENREYCLGNPAVETKHESERVLKSCPHGRVRADTELDRWTGICSKDNGLYRCSCDSGFTTIMYERNCLDAEDFRRKCLADSSTGRNRALESESDDKESASNVESKNREESSNERDLIV